MTQCWSVGYVCQVCKLKLLFWAIFIDRFLPVAFVKYILSQIYSHWIQSCTFPYFLEIVKPFVFWGKYFQNLVIFMFLFYSETNKFNNSEIVGRRKNNILNVLSIGLQYTLSFKRPDFGYNNAKSSVLKIQG